MDEQVNEQPKRKSIKFKLRQLDVKPSKGLTKGRQKLTDEEQRQADAEIAQREQERKAARAWEAADEEAARIAHNKTRRERDWWAEAAGHSEDCGFQYNETYRALYNIWFWKAYDALFPDIYKEKLAQLKGGQ